MRSAISALIVFGMVVSMALGQAPNLAGRWEGKESWGTIVLELKPDGTGELDGTPIRYTIQGNRLSVDEEGVRNDYAFQLQGNRLALSGGDLEGQMVFERAGGAPAAEAPARGIAARVKAKEQNLGTTGAQPAPAEAQDDHPTTQKAPGSIVGNWQVPDGSRVEVRADGNLTINGTPYRYTVDANTITLTGTDGSAAIPYRLADDQLTVTVQGQMMTLQRVGGAGNRSSEQAPGVTVGPQTGNRAELAGKWCYVGTVQAIGGGRVSSECFTLFPDGTFQFYAEAATSSQYGSSASQNNQVGTWTATQTTITANLQSGGTVIYQLEKRNHPKTGDPMLCLDGRCFVTYGPRAPWR